MKKKILIMIPIVFVIIIIGILAYANLKNQKGSTDAMKFKEEYESYNQTLNTNGQEIRAITISKNNPFIYKEASDIVDMIQNKETFVVYFGFPTCPWCRSVLPTLVEVAKDLKINTIYYVDILDIRDTISLGEDNKPITNKEGTDAYYELIDLLSNVLSDYSLTDSDGNKVLTGEKRIMAPNIVNIVKGKAISMTTGISNKQTNAYMELTDEMLKETYQKFKCTLKEC